ncbi:hypothetical protein K458DRAFT_417486 [Lentithecium fluviatile CBS 122367]|uniref:Uncharacterized protein n=1 Tax=Lentithecium fluviatile CBS 122367 TaxID=1168545 RepID=A0A6G1J4J5_9PLEO|nr:hypothetical protein K458DRAFT_417486 [Lentithecium fluviatile CBS 122367]
MPRPNRYHPYTRNSQMPSSRYSPGPSPPRQARPMPVITEEPQLSAQPYQYIPPQYIRGVTTDGKSLVAKSIYQSPDGTLHVEMQIAPFPSEQVRFFGSGRQFASPLSSPSLFPKIDPTLSGLGAKRQDMQRKDSATFSSQDGGSERSVEECAVVTDEEDVDTEGETEDSEEAHWRAVMEQRRIMDNLNRQRAQIQVRQ